jgi:hypothetical protein
MNPGQRMPAAARNPSVYVGQVTVGLNPGIKMVTGLMSPDHDAFGTVHFGIDTSPQIG